ncbi:MAG: CRISPR-associated protein Cas4, partial [Nanoarchaeota archaeon]|nr:CRISPR-associated protein Cas4 [Nanoarchaeota archaeon]
NKQQIIGVELLPEDLFMQVLPLIRNEAGTRSKQLFDFFSKHNVFGEELWQKLTPKILSEQKIDSPNLGLKGIIDQIEVYGEEYVPIELKTGKCPKEGVWPGHRIQVAAYALLIEDFFKKDVKEAFVNYLDSQERRQILMNQFLRLEVVGLIDKVKSLLSRYELPGLSGNENKCCMCSLKDKCFDDAYLKKLLEDKKSKTLNIRAPT